MADEPEAAPRPQTAGALAPPPRLPPGLVGSALLPPAGRFAQGYWTGIQVGRSAFFSAATALAFAAAYVLLLLVLMVALALRT
jgi:hypothetical protein